MKALGYIFGGSSSTPRMRTLATSRSTVYTAHAQAELVCRDAVVDSFFDRRQYWLRAQYQRRHQGAQ